MVAEAFGQICKNLQEQAGKSKGGVAIVGISKFQPLEKIADAVKAGVTILANNYVQEGQQLMTQLKGFGGEWHFVGQIQSRKVKSLLGYDCIQSLDRLDIATKLNKTLVEKGQTIRIFVQVNIGHEPSKAGVVPEDLDAFIDQVCELPCLTFDGLMALPPPLQPISSRVPHFEQMAQLFGRYKKSHQIRWLSMGTSEDYIEAVRAGANMVRLGSCLFGERVRA